MVAKQKTVTAEEFSDDIEAWAAAKDAGQCRFIFQGNYVDGFGEFNGGYYIEAGGAANDPVFVSGDTVINIEWLE